MIPIDYSAKNITEFLLVPYVPSCSHVPPPPPNMIINVNINKNKGVKLSYSPIEVIGKIKISKSKKQNDFMPGGTYPLLATSIKKAER